VRCGRFPPVPPHVNAVGSSVRLIGGNGYVPGMAERSEATCPEYRTLLSVDS
jgi:hypothetical protein